MYECVIQISPLERVAQGHDKTSERGLCIVYNQTITTPASLTLVQWAYRFVLDRPEWCAQEPPTKKYLGYARWRLVFTFRRQYSMNVTNGGRKAYKRVCNAHTVHTKATNRTSKLVAKLGTADVTKVRTIKINLGGIQPL